MQLKLPKTVELEEYLKQYPYINPEVVVKTDIIIRGMSFTEPALELAKGAKTKSYYLFSWDRDRAEDMQKKEYFRAPEDVRLSGGPYRLRPTIIQVRLAQDSPYCVDARDGKAVMLADGEYMGNVEYTPKPAYEDLILSDGVSRVGEIAPVTGWNWVAFVTCLRYCQYWGDQEECKFCDINENVRQQLAVGRQYTRYKRVEQVAEALEKIFVTNKDPDPERQPHTVYFSGGTIIKRVAERDDVEFYLDYVRAARDKIGGRPYIGLQTAAHVKEDARRMKEAGVTFYQPNLEVWDKRLFQIICPGKDRFVGWDEWVKRMIDAVEVFGESRVQPNLVLGVEMAQPWGFKSVDEAVESTTKGIDFLLAHGISPRMTPWLVEPLSHLGDHPIVPLDYHLKILWNWFQLLKKHRMTLPECMSPQGPGRSRYQTSAWLDLEEPRT